MLFQGIGMEFKDKIMLYCFKEVKCEQGGFHCRDLVLAMFHV